MLKRLKIQNYAIIDSVEIEFSKGLNILSGETGAGKSIIMDALFLLMGGRASADLIRKGTDEASVEALFEVDHDEELSTLLSDLGFPAEDGDLIIRRLVQSSGKNRIFINGALANTATLAQITGKLVDLCSQHDQQLLTRSEEQLLWVDRYADLENERAAVKILFTAWKEKLADLEAMSTDASERTQKLDFLRFQIQELTEAELSSPTEDTEIEQELKVLNNSEALFLFASEAESALHGGDGGETQPILDATGVLLHKVRNLVNLDPKLQPLLENFSSLKVTLDEISYFLRGYTQSVSRDEGRLEGLNARAAQLTKLKRKYGPALADVIENFARMQQELSKLENHESSLADAEGAVATARTAFDKAAKSLSKSRTKAAKEFSSAVMRELGALHMERARFEAALEALAEPSSSGMDGARFLIAANPGEPMNALSKVASGGELSRIMLAMHNVVSSRGSVGVFLFDEVDTGIGGKTAVVVGAKLQSVAKNNQVICITHLPQVAAFANAHFSVEKKVLKKAGEDRTVTSVLALTTEQDRVLEVARMLGSDKDKASISAAKSMIENARGSAKIKANSARERGAESRV